MSEPRPRSLFPLFNRIAVGLGGLGVIGFFVVAACSTLQREPDYFTRCLLAVFLLMGCLCLGGSIAFRVRSQAELDSLDAAPVPEHSPDCAISRFVGVLGGVNSIVVDFEKRTIHFRNCHTPRRFLAVAQREYRCSFADLRAVHRFQYRGESLTIVTSTGKALVPSTATNFEQLCERLPECVLPNQPALDTESPWMGLVYVAGALGGLFVFGLPFVPQHAQVGAVGMWMMLGAIAGVLLVHLLVLLVNRVWRRSIVLPLGMCISGIIAGLALGASLGPVRAWNLWFVAGPAVAGGVLGFVCGLLRQRRQAVALASTAEAGRLE